MKVKKGYLIVNGFLEEDKFKSLYAKLGSCAQKQGLCLELKRNTDLMADIAAGNIIDKNENDLPPFALFWDKDVRLAKVLEKRGMRLFNPAAAIELCDDKSLCHIALTGKVKQPDTVLVPLTFPRVGYTNKLFLEKTADYLGFPFIIKECFGSFGAQVYLVDNMAQAEEMLAKTAGRPIIAQRYISESFAKDIRAYVVGGKVAAAMLRQNHSGDFRANVALGGSVAAYTLDKAQEKAALDAAAALGCDFAGVDLLFGKDGEPIVCEVNSNAHFTGLSEATGVDVAANIIAMVAEKTASL